MTYNSVVDDMPLCTHFGLFIYIYSIHALIVVMLTGVHLFSVCSDIIFIYSILICGIYLGLLGSVAPCVLYGSNVERLGSGRGTFANHCLNYSGLYLIGESFFGLNCIAPCFSYPSRTAVRRTFNLEASDPL